MRSLVRASVRYLGFNPVNLIRQARQMRNFVEADIAFTKPDAVAEPFAIVVMPWLGTAVPWFSIACGILLSSTGSRVCFVVDGLAFGAHGLRSRFVLKCIRYVLSALPDQCEILEMGAVPAAKSLTDDQRTLAEWLANLNAIWALRGEMLVKGRSQYTKRVLAQLEVSVAAVQEFIDNHKFGCLLVPGGVYGSTGIWSALARANHVRLASFDSGGRGILSVAANGIASQLQDIPRALSLLKADTTLDEERRFVRDTALAELGRRQVGVDRFSSQLKNTTAVDSSFDGSVLLALNSSWDSAALGRHAIFDSSAQWIVETVRYGLEKTSARIVVRQHPAERFDSGRTTDDYAELLRENFGDESRVVFIAAADPVNSYELLDRASIVLVYTSTIGIEAALKGKIVITPSSSYYSHLGFVWRAAALDQYQKLIIDAVSGRYVVSQEMKDDALFCYYLTQCCNWVASPFSPEGFDDWIEIPAAKLLEHKQVDATLNALRNDVPLSFLVHLARMRAWRAEARRQ